MVKPQDRMPPFSHAYSGRIGDGTGSRSGIHGDRNGIRLAGTILDCPQLASRDAVRVIVAAGGPDERRTRWQGIADNDIFSIVRAAVGNLNRVRQRLSSHDRVRIVRLRDGEVGFHRRGLVDENGARLAASTNSATEAGRDIAPARAVFETMCPALVTRWSETRRFR